MTEPVTEYEWDQYVLVHGTRFAHCLWLAKNMPARKPRRTRRTTVKGKQ